MKTVQKLFVVGALFALAISAFAADQQQVAAANDQQVALATTAPTVPALPVNLDGDLYTPDHVYHSTWGVKDIDQKTKTGMLYWWSTVNGCSRKGVPVAIEYNGATLEIALIDKESMGGKWCTDKWFAKLEKVADGKFAGMIDVNYNARYPRVEATLQ